MRQIRVLVIDDSAIVRKVLTELLRGDPGIEVVGAAPDAYVARDKILRLKPDVLTLDLEMPRMNGLAFLKQLMEQQPMPVIVISSIALPSSDSALEAMRVGAVAVLPKPGGPYSVGDLREQLLQSVRLSVRARINPSSTMLSPFTPVESPVPAAWSDRVSVIAIGASTGGIEAISAILRKMPSDCPAILVAQHIPPVFSAAFASRLDQMCAVRVREARHDDEVIPGTVLVAPGGRHMLLTESIRRRVQLTLGAPEQYHRPSVDVLFRSVAEVAGPQAIGILLTGMGNDGAAGLLAMRRAGALTIAQNEATSVVFGMPREAIRLGAVERGMPLGQIPDVVISAIRGGHQEGQNGATDNVRLRTI